MKEKVATNTIQEDLKMADILVTGANGFIGSHLVKSLKENILKCDIMSEKNIISPKEALRQIYKSKVSKVYHLGAISATTETNIELISSTNISFSSALLEACLVKDIPFVYASSASVYGLGESGFSEKTMGNPINYYAISKMSFDMLAMQKIIDNPGSKIIGLRYFNVYGRNEDHKSEMASPVHKFLKQSTEGNIKIFNGSEDFKRDFIHVNDVVDITNKSINFPSGIYNVGTGKEQSFLEVAKIISKITGADIKQIRFPEHLIGKYQNFTCSDNSKIDKFYNKERISLEDGIAEVANGKI